MENTTCSHSPFRRPHYSSWPKRILLSINSRRRLAQLVPYSKWIYLDGHQGVDLNQMQKQFSVESFLRCSMSSTATIRLHHFPRCGKKEQKMSKILGVYRLIPSQMRERIQLLLLLTPTVLETSFANSAMRNYPMFTCIAMDVKSCSIKTSTYVAAAIWRESIKFFTKCTLSM